MLSVAEARKRKLDFVTQAKLQNLLQAEQLKAKQRKYSMYRLQGSEEV